MLLKFKSEVAFDVDGSRWNGPAALVECLEDELLPTFLALAADVMTTIGDAGEVTADAVVRALGHWELLLRNRALLSEEAQLGLWGELAFLLSAPALDAALRAWSPGARDPLDFAANGVGVYPFENAEARFAIGVFQALKENNSEPLLSLWLSDLLAALQESRETKTELDHAYKLDTDPNAFALEKAEKLTTNSERRLYLTSCWLEQLCTAEVRVLGWVYQELYGKPFSPA